MNNTPYVVTRGWTPNTFPLGGGPVFLPGWRLYNPMVFGPEELPEKGRTVLVCTYSPDSDDYHELLITPLSPIKLENDLSDWERLNFPSLN